MNFYNYLFSSRMFLTIILVIIVFGITISFFGAYGVGIPLPLITIAFTGLYFLFWAILTSMWKYQITSPRYRIIQSKDGDYYFVKRFYLFGLIPCSFKYVSLFGKKTTNEVRKIVDSLIKDFEEAKAKDNSIFL